MIAKDEEQSTAGALAHGQICYLQIPAVDVAASAIFYATIFGWTVDPPRFEAPGMIGQRVTDRPAGADAGLLAWLHVERLDDSLDLVRRKGGQVLDPPTRDGPRWLATIRDPAGNLLGLAQHGRR